MFIKRDPGPCPVDDSAHTTCCAPSSGGAIVAGPIQTPMSITVPTPMSAPPAPESFRPPEQHPPAPTASPPDTAFTTKNYRGRDTREPPTGG